MTSLDQPDNRSSKAKSQSSRLIVASFVLLAVGPLVSIRHEIASWRIASSQNAIYFGRLDQAQRELERAAEIDPQIVGEKSYVETTWKLLLLQSNSDQIPSNLTKLPENLRETALVQLAGQWMNGRRFRAAIQALKMIVPDERRSTNIQVLNSLAYARALANVELDDALLASETSLTLAKEKGLGIESLQDTKAWVLFRLGRYQEAVSLLDKVIESIESQFHQGQGPIARWLQELQSKLGTRPSEDDFFVSVDLEQIENRLSKIQNLKEEDREIALYNLLEASPTHLMAVIRFHRAEALKAKANASSGEQAILEMQRSEEDRRWIREHGFPDSKYLY